MIAFLHGQLVQKLPTNIIIECGGVGYFVRISTQAFEELPREGEGLKILIYHHFTESEQSLFGFFRAEEKGLFEKLITVKGIGPKLALTMLSGMNSGQIVESIATANVGLLSKVPGIGKKTAERIILELKDKIGSVTSSDSSAPVSKANEEVVAALVSLGYQKAQAEKALLKVLSDTPNQNNVSTLLKDALRVLNL